ncbi:hypothetical protein [Jiangella muralis]|uniref:hypothetical protein n=1 Tax=Jiangella muralis TaxID=702383 RepID=UPI00069FE46B|nr:hypothetical protein [Jiangella muralis]
MTTAAWAAAYIERGITAGELPVYGSPDFEALPPDDPRRVASCVRAAECWRLDGTDDAIRARLAEEFETNDLLVRYRISEASRDVSADYEYDNRPSWAELQRRRAELLQVPVDQYGVAS